jgi:hypothetical protein
MALSREILDIQASGTITNSGDAAGGAIGFVFLRTVV